MVHQIKLRNGLSKAKPNNYLLTMSLRKIGSKSVHLGVDWGVEWNRGGLWQNLKLAGAGDCLRAGAYTKLAIDAVDVRFDRAVTNHQLF